MSPNTGPSAEIGMVDAMEGGGAEMNMQNVYDDDKNNGKDRDFVPVGDVFCCCKPTPVRTPVEFFQRIWHWLVINKTQILSGITVALAQVPEAVSFSFVAGVKPAVGLQSAWIMGICTSLFGGRPGMVAGSTGAVAVVLTGLVKNHGQEYMFYAIMLAGLIQIAFGLLRCGGVVRLIPHPVMVGFCNGLGVVIGVAQFNIFTVDIEGYVEPEDDGHRRLSEKFGAFGPFLDQSKEWVDGEKALWMCFVIAITLVTYIVFPRFTKAIPGSLASIIMGTIAEWLLVRKAFGKETFTVEDLASVRGSFPVPIFVDEEYSPNLPSFNMETFWIILPTAITAAAIGLLESLLTLGIIDELTNTKGTPNKEAFGQGLGQLLSGLMGGMGGCTTIGQSLMNIHSGGYTRLSSSVAAIFMLLIILLIGPWINLIPIASLAGVMFVVTYYTIEWSSGFILFASLLPQTVRGRYGWNTKVKRTDMLIMVLVVAVTLIYDLAIAVAVGVLVACILFSWDAGNTITLNRELKEDGALVVYTITGPIYFGSVKPLMDQFPDVHADPKRVEVLLEDAEIFDWSGMVAIKTLHERFDRVNAEVEFHALTVGSRRLMEKSAGLWEEVKIMEPKDLELIEDPTITSHLQGEHRES